VNKQIQYKMDCKETDCERYGLCSLVSTLGPVLPLVYTALHFRVHM
jgi:hypothetical protein